MKNIKYSESNISYPNLNMKIRWEWKLYGHRLREYNTRQKEMVSHLNRQLIGHISLKEKSNDTLLDNIMPCIGKLFEIKSSKNMC